MIELQGTYVDRNLAEQLWISTLTMTRQCWEQGMMAYAMLFCGEDRLLHGAVHDIVLRQSPDGRLCNVENTPAVTDSAFNIPAVWALKSNKDYKQAAVSNVHYLLHDAQRDVRGVCYHMRGMHEIWADSAAFLPYSFALTGYPEEAVRQMQGILDCLYLRDCGLYAHIFDTASNDFTDVRAWGAGNGWILTGLLRLIRILREQGIGDAQVLQPRFQVLLERMLSYATPEGAFYDVLDDPGSFPETETAAMVAVTIFQGIRDGLVDETLLPQALQIRKYVLSMVDTQGLVRGACSSPRFDRPGSSVECQAHVLMMEHAAVGYVSK